MSLEERIQQVEARIADTCRCAGRDRGDVRVIAVTKYVSLEQTAEVIDRGYMHIGENRWQDAAPKWHALGPRAEWHFIGHLQTNKVKDVVGRFAYIHSLDRSSLAAEINRKAIALGITVKCFIQLNVSGEETKHGLAPGQLFDFAREVRDLSGIEVVGLMTMAPLDADPEAARPVFRGLRELRDRLNKADIFPYPVSHLSMGMSNDFTAAIEEGATWVRLGSILVGRT